jgi:hypothetical protein
MSNNSRKNDVIRNQIIYKCIEDIFLIKKTAEREFYVFLVMFSNGVERKTC